jgi:hypothetical protein
MVQWLTHPTDTPKVLGTITGCMIWMDGWMNFGGCML